MREMNANDIVQGLMHLHEEHSIAHGNLKASNILFDDNLNVVLGDYCYHLLLKEYSQAEIGSPSLEADVLAFPMIMIELLTGKPIDFEEFKSLKVDVGFEVLWKLILPVTGQGKASIDDSGDVIVRGEAESSRFSPVRRPINRLTRRISRNGVNEEGTCLTTQQIAEDVVINHPKLLKQIASYSTRYDDLAIFSMFMRKGSLMDVLFDETKKVALNLNWNMREMIANDIVQGLMHLHEEHFIAHGNLKASNILFDDNMNVVLGDYCYHLLFKEYSQAEIGYPSLEADVLAFGMIMIEFCGGKGKASIDDSGDVIVMIEIEELPIFVTLVLTVLFEDPAIFSMFMRSGNLMDVLFDKTKKVALNLNWNMCEMIANDIVHGLMHLHEEHSIAHGNLKASNILFDDNLNVVLGDYCYHLLLKEYSQEEIGSPSLERGEAESSRFSPIRRPINSLTRRISRNGVNEEDETKKVALNLNWNMREMIANDIVQGLMHLHEEHSIAHGNLKASNILFDDNLNDVLGDYFHYGLTYQLTAAGCRTLGTHFTIYVLMGTAYFYLQVVLVPVVALLGELFF
ncbi:hypothetical protein L6452_15684 [Arctium lappa]|uniref:Uncharacterized protein n=1 Tax=Arctium lappa TaxID=4217 RepID=A0ACB9CPG8_ARCLA|nr:hypothetical protein L6452_15684 [Arctium lappa]